MDEKPNYFAIIPANVRYDNDLRPNEKLLYGEITALAQKTGECWASNKYFSDLYGVKSNAVATWIRHLKEKKYIILDYKYKGKEIQKRIIKLGGIQKDNTYSQKDMRVVSKKIGGTIQKGEENNINNTNNTSTNNTRSEYRKPTLDEILEFSKTINFKNESYCRKFYYHYESKNWAGVTNWRAKFNYWLEEDKKKKSNIYPPNWYGENIKEQKASDDEIKELERIIDEI